MIASTKKWIYTPKTGSNIPIIVEFTYEDWRRLERLSNRKGDWLIKVYNTIFKKAGLLDLQTLKQLNIKPEIKNIAAGRITYERICKIGEKKYGEKNWPWVNLEIGLSNYINSDDPFITENQIIIRPIAFGLHEWKRNIIATS